MCVAVPLLCNSRPRRIQGLERGLGLAPGCMQGPAVMARRGGGGIAVAAVHCKMPCSLSGSVLIISHPLFSPACRLHSKGLPFCGGGLMNWAL